MLSNKSSEQSDSLTHQATQSADQAIRATQRLASETLDSLAAAAQDLMHQVEPPLNRVGDQLSAMAQRGAASVRDTSQHMRDKAQQASNTTINFIKNEPVKAVLIAAAVGAALTALISQLSQSRGRR